MPAPVPTKKGSVRVDKWLWAARCFKTRTQASKACDAGHVRIDGATVKGSTKVKPGVTVDVLCPAGRRLLEVAALADKRGPADVARALYIDHTPTPEPRERLEPVFERERGMGRPTKRDRRLLDVLREDDW